jgi:hypothetical protein
VYAGKVGLWMGSFLERGGERSQVGAPWPFSWGMVSLPRGERAASLAEVEAYVISSLSDHTGTCWSWISFLSKNLTSLTRLVPARRSLIESPEYEELVGSEMAAVVRFRPDDLLMPPVYEGYVRYAPVLERFGEAVDRIIQGSWTPQEAMDTLQRQAGP